MLGRISLRSFSALGVTLLFAATGCGEGEATPAACPEGNSIGGACAGAPSEALCDDSTCSAGVECASVVTASDEGSLTTAALNATPGTCIALAPGEYGSVTVPGGVSLLGKGAGAVTLSRVIMGSGGSGAVLRGVTVAGGGLDVQGGAVGVKISATRVKDSFGVGLAIGPGAEVSVSESEIMSSGDVGVRVFDSATVSIDASIIQGSKGPGLWAQCGADCDCPAPLNLSVSKSILRDNKLVGLSLVGASATLSAVDVRDNTEAPNFKGSGGISASACSTLTANGVRILDNSSFGLLVDRSSATIGGAAPEQAIEVSRNFMGVWVQNVTDAQQVKLEGLSVTDNQGVGLGTSGAARGIICWNSAITGTKSTMVPVIANGAPGAQEVGDGLSWTDGSQMQLDRVTLGGNARASVLIDGAVADGSAISNVTLSSGDEGKGIVQQNTAAGEGKLMVGAGAPAVMASEGELFSVPVAPALPTGG